MILNRLINITFSIYDSKFLWAQRKRKKTSGFDAVFSLVNTNSKKKSLGTPLLFLNLTIGQLGFIDVN